MVYTELVMRRQQFHVASAMQQNSTAASLVDIIQNTLIQLHATRAQCVGSDAENSALVAVVKHFGLILR